jgi:hypothetical protein
MKVPVTRFEVRPYKVYFDYAAWTVVQEYAVTLAGVASNAALFLVFVLISLLMKGVFDAFPRRWFTIICYYGFAVILDPWLILLFDIFDAKNIFDYSDWTKLYRFNIKNKENPVVGLIAAFMIFFLFTVYNFAAFYVYMIYFH